MKFLLVEDEKIFAEALMQVLAQHRYLVDLATNGAIGWEMADSFPYDLILLDWVVPELNGIEICQKLRATGNTTPIILMTAREASTDRIAGLDAGADDYLVKPFEFEELLARIRALLRRSEGIASPILQWGDLRLDPSSAEVSFRHLPISLTPKEYALLELLLRNPSRIFSLDTLLDKVWPFEESPSVGSVRTHIKGLRQKLRAAEVPEMIETVYGLGYRLKPVDAPLMPSLIPPEAPPSPSARVQLEIEALWQPLKGKYLKRVREIGLSIDRLAPGPIDPDLQQHLRAEAHTLAGSLGSFGFEQVTLRCREIENTLVCDRLEAEQIEQLESLVSQVQKNLEETTPNQAKPTPHPPPLAEPNPLLLIVEPDGDPHWQQLVVTAAASRGLDIDFSADINQVKTRIFEPPPPQAALSQPLRRPEIIALSLGEEDSPEKTQRFALLRDLHQASPPVPVIVFADHASFETRVKTARLGAAGLLSRPVIAGELVESALRILQKGVPPAAKLLIVDDEPDVLNLLHGLLSPWGLQLQLLSDPQQFWEQLEQFVPDLVVLDVEMSHLSGLDLCQVLRNAPSWSDLPVLFLSAHTDADTIQRVFAAGADDYIRKPVVAPELVARVLSWLERARVRRLRADMDNLTSVANRRKSTQDMMRLLGLAHRQGQPFCFALIDLDFFKRINDVYGHGMGDRVLRQFGVQLRSTFRGEDVVARWGGEEFVVGLYGVSAQEGKQRLEEFLEHWQQMSFSTTCLPGQSEEATFSVTFTAGIALFPQDAEELQGLYLAADAALYKAKAAGRNRVLLAQPDPD